MVFNKTAEGYFADLKKSNLILMYFKENEYEDRI